jgi:chloramphenicol-sensitive protein RarD
MSCATVQRVSDVQEICGDAVRARPAANRAARIGFFLGIGAHVWWGVVPIYFHAMADVRPWIVLCHRVVWSVAFVALIISIRGDWPAIGQALRNRRTVLLLSLSAVLIATNWLLFIHAISTGKALQASLGYFMNPLLTVALGRIFLGEHLRKWQWAAVGMAVVAVLNLSIRAGAFPGLAVALALSFGFYGLVRKMVDINSLHGLMVESIILLPVAVAALVFCAGLSAWQKKMGLLSLSGIITAIPLLMFGAAVRRLRLSTMGFLQYVGPTIQFLVAVLIFHEPLSHAKLVSFGLCWLAIAVYVTDTLLAGDGNGSRGRPK